MSTEASKTALLNFLRSTTPQSSNSSSGTHAINPSFILSSEKSPVAEKKEPHASDSFQLNDKRESAKGDSLLGLPFMAASDEAMRSYPAAKESSHTTLQGSRIPLAGSQPSSPNQSFLFSPSALPTTVTATHSNPSPQHQQRQPPSPGQSTTTTATATASAPAPAPAPKQDFMPKSTSVNMMAPMPAAIPVGGMPSVADWKEMEARLLTRLESHFEEQRKALDKDRMALEASNLNRQSTLLKLVSESLNTTLKDGLQTMIRSELHLAFEEKLLTRLSSTLEKLVLQSETILFDLAKKGDSLLSQINSYCQECTLAIQSSLDAREACSEEEVQMNLTLQAEELLEAGDYTTALIKSLKLKDAALFHKILKTCPWSPDALLSQLSLQRLLDALSLVLETDLLKEPVLFPWIQELCICVDEKALQLASGSGSGSPVNKSSAILFAPAQQSVLKTLESRINDQYAELQSAGIPERSLRVISRLLHSMLN